MIRAAGSQSAAGSKTSQTRLFSVFSVHMYLHTCWGLALALHCWQVVELKLLFVACAASNQRERIIFIIHSTRFTIMHANKFSNAPIKSLHLMSPMAQTKLVMLSQWYRSFLLTYSVGFESRGYPPDCREF